MNILLLSEDGSEHARPTLEALVKKMLRLMGGQYRDDEVRFEPPDDATVAIARGNLWKSTNPKHRREIVALRRALATKLTEDPRGFVLFHIDGDRRWSEGPGCENRAQFEEVIAAKVRERIAETKSQWTKDELDRCMKRLVLLVPFYSVEAWVYQNIKHARALCSRHHGGQHAQQFDAWERDRAALDEIVKPKEAGCLRSKYNRDLAENEFPHKKAYDAGTSFHAAVEALGRCEDLRDAVRATWQPPGTQAEP
jgi:hypothetical protein